MAGKRPAGLQARDVRYASWPAGISIQWQYNFHFSAHHQYSGNTISIFSQPSIQWQYNLNFSARHQYNGDTISNFQLAIQFPFFSPPSIHWQYNDMPKIGRY
jgi:hypothetical protein